MDLGVISIRYARALHKSAMQAGCDEAVCHDMTALLKAYTQLPQLRQTIDNPMLRADMKEKLLAAACGETIDALTKRFLHLVVKEGREPVMQLIASSFITLYREQKNIIHGRLITAAAVTPETEAKMKRMVENKTQGTVEFLTEVNPDIIGGFILEYDTYRMDASVKSQLNSILKKLK